MVPQTIPIDEFRAELEALGEDEVRQLTFVRKRYGEVGSKRAFVDEWLRSKERERSERSNSEQRRIARSAKNAAWAAAIAAIIAGICASVSDRPRLIGPV